METLEKKLYLNHNQRGEEVLSIYPTNELIDRLRSYNSPGSLISLDIDRCMRESVVKAVVIKSLFKPSRWWRHPEWLLDFSYVFPTAQLCGWSREEMETFFIAYAEKHILPYFKESDLKKMVKEASPPFFPGVKETVSYFSEAERIIVSRAFKEVVEDNLDELEVGEGYYRADDKAGTLLDHAQEIGARRVLVFGDLSLDVDSGMAAKEEGYGVDIVQVKKCFNSKYFDERATIFIPRNWSGLYELLHN